MFVENLNIILDLDLRNFRVKFKTHRFFFNVNLVFHASFKVFMNMDKVMSHFTAYA